MDSVGSEASSEAGREYMQTRVQFNTPGIDFTGSAFGVAQAGALSKLSSLSRITG